MTNLKPIEEQKIEKIDEKIYDRKYLDIVTQYLTDNITKAREEIKLKTKLKAEEVRSIYQLKYMLGKCIENVEIDLDNEKKCKMNSNRNYLENIWELLKMLKKRIKDNLMFDKNIEILQNQLFMLTYIFDNSFEGSNNINSIFPKFREK